MDKIQRETMFAGLTDREIVESVVYEMRRRRLYGILFTFPENGGPSVMGSSSPPCSLRGMCAAEQLTFFAQCAMLATSEREQPLSEEPEEGKKWLN